MSPPFNHNIFCENCKIHQLLAGDQEPGALGKVSPGGRGSDQLGEAAGTATQQRTQLGRPQLQRSQSVAAPWREWITLGTRQHVPVVRTFWDTHSGPMIGPRYLRHIALHCLQLSLIYISTWIHNPSCPGWLYLRPLHPFPSILLSSPDHLAHTSLISTHFPPPHSLPSK